jgi:hypothetical protein
MHNQLIMLFCVNTFGRGVILSFPDLLGPRGHTFILVKAEGVVHFCKTVCEICPPPLLLVNGWSLRTILHPYNVTTCLMWPPFYAACVIVLHLFQILHAPMGRSFTARTVSAIGWNVHLMRYCIHYYSYIPNNSSGWK